MRTPSDFGHSARLHRRRWTSLSALALAALLPALATPPLAAQMRPHPTTGRFTPESRQLRQSLERLYEILPVRGGLLLKPRVSRNGVRTLELADGSIAVNGETVTPSVLRAWLGDDAPAVLELSELDPLARRQLFGLSTADVSASPARPATPPDTPRAAGDRGLPLPPVPPATPVPERSSAPSATESTDDGAEASEPPSAPEAPEAPERPSRRAGSSGSQVRVGGGVTVEANEVVEDAMAIGGPVHVEGEVIGDVSAVGGSATINGKVGGGVTAVAGSVRLGPKAEVSGDVTCVMGHIEVDPGAKIHGTKTEVSPSEFFAGGRRIGRHPHFAVWPFFGAVGFFWTVLQILLHVLLVWFTLLVARPTVERLERRLAAQPWESGGVGLLSWVALFPLVAIVTLLTCCLFVIFWPVVFLAVLVVGVLGYTVVVYRVGRWSGERFGGRLGDNPYLAALVGMAWIESLTVVGRLLELTEAPFGIAAAMVSLGNVVFLGAMIFGTGVVLLDRFSTGWRRRPPVSPIAPIPPAPPAPPIEPVL